MGAKDRKDLQGNNLQWSTAHFVISFQIPTIYILNSHSAIHDLQLAAEHSTPYSILCDFRTNFNRIHPQHLPTYTYTIQLVILLCTSSRPLENISDSHTKSIQVKEI